MTVGLIIALLILAFAIGAMTDCIIRHIVDRQYRRPHIKITTENNEKEMKT